MRGYELHDQMRDQSCSDGLLACIQVLEPPSGYAPIRTPARKLMGTPTPIGGTPMYQIPEEDRGQQFDVPQAIEGLPELKPEDHQYFGKLLKVCRLSFCALCAYPVSIPLHMIIPCSWLRLV